MKAFTITELVIVLAIIGILSAILIPTFASVVKSSTREAIEIRNGENIESSFSAYSNFYYGNR